MEKEVAEALNRKHPDDLFFLGVTQALQALTSVLLDTEEKRIAVLGIIEALSESTLHSALTDDRKASYLEGLSALGVAAQHARQLPRKP